MRLRLALSLATLLAFATAVSADLETVYPTDDLRPLNMPPTYSNRYLAVHDRQGISVYGPDGASRYGVPYSQIRGVKNIALDTDGTFAATLQRSMGNGQVVLCDGKGSLLRVIETPDFQPSTAAFAPDRSIWIIGVRWRQNAGTSGDYAMLRHFSREGSLLGSFLPRSSFSTIDDPLQTVTALPDIHISNGRIGLYLQARTHSKSLWVETDMNGKELGRWSIGFDATPLAFTTTGRVYARAIDGIYTLDHAARKWTLAPMAARGTLIGADGEMLAFADRSSSRVYLALEPHLL